MYQAIGRGTRIHPNKKDCLIADFVGNISKFGKIENLVIEARYGTDEVWSGTRKLSSVNLSEMGVMSQSDAVKMGGMKMPFGKFKDQYITTLKTQYLAWLLENFSAWNMYSELKSEVEGELLRRQAVLADGV